MTAASFAELLKLAGLTKTELAQLLGVRRDTVSFWKDAPPRYARAYLKLYLGYRALEIKAELTGKTNG